MSRGNAKLEVGQLVLTSSTPPGNLGLYAKDENTIGVVGDLVCIDPKSKAESSVVTSIVDPVTGGISLSSGGSTLLPGIGAPLVTSPLGLIGDSRFSQYGVFNEVTTVASLDGTTLSITGTYIGNLCGGVGDTIILAFGVGVDYIRATVASIVSPSQITSTVVYPVANALPSGSIWQATTRVYAVAGTVNYSTAIPAWILAFRNSAYQDVRVSAFGGSTTQMALSHQAADLIRQGCKEFWIHIGANDYLTATGNKTSAYCIQKIKELWSALAGNRIVHFLETPISGGYASTTNKTRLTDINTWVTENAASYGVIVFDSYSPILDTATGEALSGMTIDGLHLTQLGALTIALTASLPAFAYPASWEASTQDAGTARQPIPNPSMAGTLGASQVPTGYGGSLSNTSLSSYGTELTDVGTAQQFYANIVASAAGHYKFQTAAATVVPGQKYKIKATLEVVGGANINYPEIAVYNSAGGALILGVFTSSVGGIGDGSYIVTGSANLTIPPGITAVRVSCNIYFSAAGSAGIRVRNIEMRPI